jgi:5-hydroxyisourate hydrolase
MISTHILDLTTGFPAKAVRVLLEKRDASGVWALVRDDETNADGRIVFDVPREAGAYRLTFSLESYFRSRGQEPFFLDAPVAFEIRDTGRKYHVPLLLSAYGWSTYRGS